MIKTRVAWAQHLLPPPFLCLWTSAEVWCFPDCVQPGSGTQMRFCQLGRYTHARFRRLKEGEAIFLLCGAAFLLGIKIKEVWGFSSNAPVSILCSCVSDDFQVPAG